MCCSLATYRNQDASLALPGSTAAGDLASLSVPERSKAGWQVLGMRLCCPAPPAVLPCWCHCRTEPNESPLLCACRRGTGVVRPPCCPCLCLPPGPSARSPAPTPPWQPPAPRQWAASKAGTPAGSARLGLFSLLHCHPLLLLSLTTACLALPRLPLLVSDALCVVGDTDAEWGHVASARLRTEARSPTLWGILGGGASGSGAGSAAGCATSGSAGAAASGSG